MTSRQAKSRQCILIVDDNPINQVYFSAALRKGGFPVKSATSGPQALTLAGQHRFGLILMDIRMPGMDGYQTLAALHRKPGPNRHTPVVAVSAERLDSGKESLFSGFLIKPVAKHDLLQTAMRHVGRPASSNPEPPPGTTQKTPQPAPAVPVIDSRQSLKAVGNNAGIARRLQAMLRQELPSQLQQLQTFHHNGDVLGLRELLHRMMGSASFCGASQLSQALRNYSAIIKNNQSQPEAWHNAHRQVENAIANILEDLSP